jgi:hypothetical protein
MSLKYEPSSDTAPCRMTGVTFHGVVFPDIPIPGTLNPEP